MSLMLKAPSVISLNLASRNSLSSMAFIISHVPVLLLYSALTKAFRCSITFAGTSFVISSSKVPFFTQFLISLAVARWSPVLLAIGKISISPCLLINAFIYSIARISFGFLSSGVSLPRISSTAACLAAAKEFPASIFLFM